MFRVLAVASEDLCSGFALAGVDVAKSESAAAAAEAVESAIRTGDYGLVIIDERYVVAFDEKLQEVVKQSDLPLFVSIPGEIVWSDLEKSMDDDYIAAFIKHAIGYELNMNM